MLLAISDGTSPTSFSPNRLELALMPTQFFGPNGNPIWETELELDQLQTFIFLNGGPFAPGVQQIVTSFLGGPPPTTPLNAVAFNQYRVSVLNEDGSSSTLTPASSVLRVQDTR